MTQASASEQKFRRTFILLLVGVLGAVYIGIIADFLVALFLAATIAAMTRPLFIRTRDTLGDRPRTAAAVLIVALTVGVMIPALALLALVANEALAVSEIVAPWVERQIKNPIDLSTQLPDWLPLAAELEPYKSRILEKLSEAAGAAGSFLVSSISNVTQGAISFLLSSFIMLYALYFFVISGPEISHAAAQYIPLKEKDRKRVLEKGVSVTRATLKSILVIGLLQGAMVAMAFFAVGIEGPLFWGSIVVVLSSVPAAGPPIVWGPAALYLLMSDQILAGIGLIVWGVVAVGLIDNVLRPRLVSEETQMPDLLILVSILGGISAFGAIGILLGPILAGYLLVVLEIYREVFADSMPDADESADSP